MSDEMVQQMILRRVRDDAPTTRETVMRLSCTGAVVVDQKPASVLIEGSEQAIRDAAATAIGWTAIPMRRYPVPDTRQKIKD